MGYEAIPLRLPEHRESLAALWRENLSDPRIVDAIPERIRWLYERKPGGPALTWLAVVSGTEDVIGCGSLLRRDVVVDGRTVPAGLLADFAVTKRHRIAGAAITIQRAVAHGSAREGVELLLAYPNAKSLPIFQRLGYTPVGESRRWVKPLCTASMIRARTKNGALARLAPPVADAGLALADRVRSIGSGEGRRREFFEVDRADGRFDDLWERARATCRIGGERSAAYLNWRYAGFTTQRHRFFCCRDRATGALVGYVVYAVRDGGVATIEDLLGTNLLLPLAAHLRREGVSSLSCTFLGPESFGVHLRVLGFLPRAGGRSVLAMRPPAHRVPAHNAIFDASAWLMTDGELDI